MLIWIGDFPAMFDYRKGILFAEWDIHWVSQRLNAG